MAKGIKTTGGIRVVGHVSSRSVSHCNSRVLESRRQGSRGRRGEGAMSLALKTEEEAVSQGVQVASGSQKGRKWIFSLSLQEELTAQPPS